MLTAIKPPDESSDNEITGAAAEGKPPPQKPSAKKPRGWFDKIFSRGFTPEDLVLYLLSALLILSFWSIFNGLQEREERLIQSISSKVAEEWNPASPKDAGGMSAGLDDDEWITMNHMAAQLTLSAMRYQQGSISTAAISTRKNLAFLAGTILAIIGCVIVIRGVRQSNISFDLNASDKARVTLLTSSPGVFVVLMGAIIIVTTILTSGERPQITDNGIDCLRCGIVVLGPGETAAVIMRTSTPTTRDSSPAVTVPPTSGFPTTKTTPNPPPAAPTSGAGQ